LGKFRIFSTISIFIFSTWLKQSGMKKIHDLKFIVLPLLLIGVSCTETQQGHKDWLLDRSGYISEIKDAGNRLIMTNGLITRTFSLKPDGATIGFHNNITNKELLRSVKPEAVITVDGTPVKIGGLTGQPVNNYLPEEWIESMKPDTLSPFSLREYITGEILPRFEWKKRPEWMPGDLPWPPKGKSIAFTYSAMKVNSSATGIEVIVNYEIYDGIPLISKWITVNNNSGREIMINSYKSEILAFAESESAVGDKKNWIMPDVYVETDYAFGGSMSSESCFEKSVWWVPDADYKTIVNYNRIQPSLLECRPVTGPSERVGSGGSFSSFRTWILINDSSDRERNGLAQRKMYRTIAPWITENPIFMHLRYSDNQSVKDAVDQCAETGFEKIILSFGSGFDIEDTSMINLNKYKELVDYAHSKGITLGGYSLLASRRVGGGNDVVMPEGMKPVFGNSPCLGSIWGEEYFSKLYRFIEYTGFDNFEHDGSYPGDVCASENHPGHEGYDDSQWKQFNIITDFYKWCRGRGVYLTVPDWYFLNGSSKTGMGYRESNWSLPRRQQEIIERQNIFDGTWEKTPSMGWMHVPLVEYQGGGAEATIEPLRDHLPHYGQRLADLFGAGVQAAWRGKRLYDAPETLDLVKKWVSFYKKHRVILDADIIHIRRPDGKDIDAILHADPANNEKGLLMVYNPLSHQVKKDLKVNVYYTGLSKHALISENDKRERRYSVDRNYNVTIPVNVDANGVSWYILK
jgi:hypothetical protein